MVKLVILLAFTTLMACIMAVLAYWPLQTMLLVVGFVLGVNASLYIMGTR